MQGFQVALIASYRAKVLFAAILGVVCHQVVRSIAIDNHGWYLIFSYLCATALLFAADMFMTDINITEAILHIWSVGGAFLVGLYGSMLLYRAFFHRLKGFPGPFAARLSKIYHLVAILRSDQQYHLHIQKLHQQYGDFVRTGPREISITRSSAIDLIYGSQSKCEKATWYDQNSGDADKVGIENVRDRNKHRLRRRTWDKGLGFRALNTYESRIKGKVDLFMNRIGSKKPLDITQQSVFYSFDVMGDVALSQDFNMLVTGEEHPAVASLHDAMSIAGIVTTLPWLMNMLRVVPGATGRFERFAGWCYDQLRIRRESLSQEKSNGKSQPPRDVMTWLIEAQVEGSRSAPPTEAAIQEDIRTLISAGSDTVALTFTNFLYFMGKNPATYKKVQRLVENEFKEGYSTWTYARVKNIPYLDYLIQETLRLRPAVPMGFLRMTPPEGLLVDEVFVPGDTNVSIPIWTMHRDARAFDNPNDFVPERWEGVSPDTAAYMPFLRGQFACSGKQLALMQLRMLISCLALRYEVAFAPGEDGRKFETEEKETLTLWLPPLQMTFTPK